MIKKKKLIIFMPSIEKGGVEKNLFIIPNYLSSKINNVKLITANVENRGLFKNITLIPPSLKFKKDSNRYYKYLICLIELIKILLKNNDITVFSFQANLYCTIICKLFGANIIVRSNSSPSGWSKNIIKKFFYKNILKLADEVIVNSYDFKKQFKIFFSVDAECIYNPLNKKEIIQKSKERINLPFFVKNKKKSIKLINVARFTSQKDHITLLKSLNLIKNKVDFRMIIIGQGAQKNFIKNYINDNNLSEKIKIMNFQKNPFKFIKQSDAFILTSRYEGLPNVLLEAIVLKKLIISTDCPTGPREILKNGKGGELFKVGDYFALSKKISSYAKNKLSYNKKINFAYNSLDRFDYNYNLNKYYNSIIKYI